MPQPADYKVAVITGTTGGVTGAEIVPSEMVMVVRDVAYSEMQGTGANVRLAYQPSGVNFDARRLSASTNFELRGSKKEGVLGTIPADNVPQVTVNQGNIVARIVYTLEYGRYD